jgi:tetratricopeptide (TPR) repeat protein
MYCDIVRRLLRAVVPSSEFGLLHPFWDYLASVRLAVPPILLLFFSYILVFIGGTRLGEAPKVIITFLKSQFFQSTRMMIASCLFLIGVSLGIIVFTASVPPPAYAQFVTTLLGGEADRYTLVKNQLEKIETQNAVLGQGFRIAVRVFEERSKRNFNHAVLDTTIPRIFVRSLEAAQDNSWTNHPIRFLALAEAYSMWAQAEKSSPLRKDTDTRWRNLLENSLRLNGIVANTRGRGMHPLLKFSAINNSGNAQYYVGNFQEAQIQYQAALALNRNLTSAGNLIAVLIVQNCLDQALHVTEDTRQWAFDTGKALMEPSQFASVLVNGSFAHMIKGDFFAVCEYLREAYALESDNLNALNLAVAAVLAGDRSTADIVLKHFMYPALELPDQARRVREDYDACYYLVKALLISDQDTSLAAAHYYTYMKIARTERQLSEVTASELANIKAVAFDYLSEDSTSCRDLALIPALRDRLKPPTIQGDSSSRFRGPARATSLHAKTHCSASAGERPPDWLFDNGCAPARDR